MESYCSLLCLWKCILNQTHLKMGVSHSPPYEIWDFTAELLSEMCHDVCLIDNMGFTLHTKAFTDATFLKYGWNLTASLLCLWKWILNQTHLKRGVSRSPPYEIWLCTAELLSQVCHDVCLIDNMGFTLHKRAFNNAVFLSYGWNPPIHQPTSNLYDIFYIASWVISSSDPAFFKSVWYCFLNKRTVLSPRFGCCISTLSRVVGNFHSSFWCGVSVSSVSSASSIFLFFWFFLWSLCDIIWQLSFTTSR